MHKNNLIPFEYFLPNGLKIDMRGFLKAINTDLKNEHDFPHFYLDTEKGDVCEIDSTESLIILVEKIGDSDRYISVSSMCDKNYEEINKFLIDFSTNPLTEKQRDNSRRVLLKDGWQKAVDYTASLFPKFKQVFQNEVDDFKLEYIENFMENFPKIQITKKFVGCKNCDVCKKIKKDGIETSVFKGEVANNDLENQEQVKKIVKSKRRKPQKALQIKVTLEGSKPSIWRRFAVQDNYTFFDLHVAIQDVMGWQDCHQHSFSYSKNRFESSVVIQFPDPEDAEYFIEKRAFDEREMRVMEFLKKEKDHLKYEYDFGDGWTHKIELEKIIDLDSKDNYPQIISGKGYCPWEDSGGIWGFYEKVKILKSNKKSNKEEKSDIIEWLVGIGKFDRKKIENQIAEIDLAKFDIKKVHFNDPDLRLKEIMSMM